MAAQSSNSQALPPIVWEIGDGAGLLPDACNCCICYSDFRELIESATRDGLPPVRRIYHTYAAPDEAPRSHDMCFPCARVYFNDDFAGARVRACPACRREPSDDASLYMLPLEGPRLLIRAAREGRLALVTALLNHPMVQESFAEIGTKALAEAAFKGHLEIVRAILTHANAGALTPRHLKEALFSAVYQNNPEIVRAILTHANAGALTPTDLWEVLAEATLSGHPEIVHAILTHGNPGAITPEHLGKALVFAVYGEHLEVVRTTLAHANAGAITPEDLGRALRTEPYYYIDPSEPLPDVLAHHEIIRAIAAHQRAHGGVTGRLRRLCSPRTLAVTAVAMLAAGAATWMAFPSSDPA